MTPFHIDSDLVIEIKDLIAKEDKTRLKRKLKPAHYADLGELIEYLTISEATYLIKLLGSDTTADALAEVDPDIRKAF
jgi:magnesium transporter